MAAQKDLENNTLTNVAKEPVTTTRYIYRTSNYQVTVPGGAFDKFGDMKENDKKKWLKSRMRCRNPGAVGKDWDEDFKALYVAIFG